MKVPKTLLLCLLLATAAAAQTSPLLERAGDFQFGAGEHVVAHGLTGDHRLVLVGPKTVRVLDFASAKLTDPRPHNIPGLDAEDKLLISPAGPRMLVVPRKPSRPAAVWDLEKGTQLATLKTRKPVRAGLWSGDGRTLATSSNEYAPFTVGATSVEVAFWDGETLALLSTLPSNKVGWWQMTADGRTCFFSVGDPKNYLFRKYIRGPGAGLSVWDVRAGRVGQTISAGGASVRAVYVSPGEKYLAFVARPPRSEDEARYVAVYDIAQGASGRELRPRHELKPVPSLPLPGAMFSPGAKYFAVDAGEGMRIYESASGEKRLELAGFGLPNGWLNDETFLNYSGCGVKAYDVATGKLLYDLKLPCRSEQHTTDAPPGEMAMTVNVVFDTSKINVRRGGRTFLTYSDQYVKVFDSRTGDLLQELLSPPMDYTKKIPRLSDTALVSEANWSYDGRALYVLSADKKSVSLWRQLDS